MTVQRDAYQSAICHVFFFLMMPPLTSRCGCHKYFETAQQRCHLVNRTEIKKRKKEKKSGRTMLLKVLQQFHHISGCKVPHNTHAVFFFAFFVHRQIHRALRCYFYSHSVQLHFTASTQTLTQNYSRGSPDLSIKQDKKVGKRKKNVGEK